MDALGEISLQWSPYTYGKNNPVRYIDPSAMADKDSKGGDSDDDMDEGLLGSGKDVFGRDKYDNKSGLYIPFFERGDIDWSNLILNNASRFRPQTVNGNENINQGGKSKPAWDADYRRPEINFTRSYINTHTYNEGQ